MRLARKNRIFIALRGFDSDLYLEVLHASGLIVSTRAAVNYQLEKINRFRALKSRRFRWKLLTLGAKLVTSPPTKSQLNWMIFYFYVRTNESNKYWTRFGWNNSVRWNFHLVRDGFSVDVRSTLWWHFNCINIRSKTKQSHDKRQDVDYLFDIRYSICNRFALRHLILRRK